WALAEARDQLREQGIATEYCRVRALPVGDDVANFVTRHERVYVIEQNRDGQFAAMLRARLSGALADRLRSVCHYKSTPIAATNIVRPILGWEKDPTGPGWPTGNVDIDNPKVPHAPELSPE